MASIREPVAQVAGGATSVQLLVASPLNEIVVATCWQSISMVFVLISEVFWDYYIYYIYYTTSVQLLVASPLNEIVVATCWQSISMVFVLISEVFLGFQLYCES